MVGGVNIKGLIQESKKNIKNDKELDYFLTHYVRYEFVLEQVMALNLPKQSRILDVGCFPPHLLNALRFLGYEVWGISSKHEPIKDEKIVSLNLERDKLPFKSDFFDLIIFTEIIEHLLVNPQVYLDKLKKVLKEDGRILITTPNAAHLKNRAKLAIGKSSHFSLNQLYETDLDNDSIYYRHNREFTLSELSQIMRDNSFKIYKSGYFSAYPPYRDRLDKPRLGTQIIKNVGFLLTILYSGFKDSIFVIVGKK